MAVVEGELHFRRISWLFLGGFTAFLSGFMVFLGGSITVFSVFLAVFRRNYGCFFGRTMQFFGGYGCF